MKQKLLAQGAEAKIYLIDSIILKSRTKKSYRHPTLDIKIRKRRTRAEAKILAKALQSKINVPQVIKQDSFNLEIEFLKGDKLSQTLNAYPEKKQFQIMQKLGKQVSLLHQNNIIHGDLTTSNTILKDDKVFVIDFGLGFISRKIEDKAVDIHLIKQALSAKHYQNHEELFKNFLSGYSLEEKQKILERLTAVERRGRYQH
jgi:TP53 regulating kinase and related kinases